MFTKLKDKKNYVKKSTKLPAYVPLPSSMIGSEISSSALILYAVLLNRVSLSQKNNMVDEFGNVYVIYPIHQLSVQLGLSESQVKRLIKELVSAGMLVKKDGGFNKPNHLFVLLPGEQERTAVGSKNDTTVGANMALQAVQKGTTNNLRKIHDEDIYRYEEGESF